MHALLVVCLVVAIVACDGGAEQDGAGTAALTVTSAAFEDGADIPVAHTCDGEDEPPPLSWDTPPAAASEVAVVVDDPDAPGGAFVHWLVAGLPPEPTTLDGPLPAGAVEGTNDFDEAGWGGPCPPAGDDPHTYRFRVLALAEAAGLDAGFSAEELEDASAGSVLAEGTLTGRYGR